MYLRKKTFKNDLKCTNVSFLIGNFPLNKKVKKTQFLSYF